MKNDSQLQQDVMAELKWDASVNAALIGVEVQDGVVNLTGRVNSYANKLAAERAAQRVSGVKALAIDMEVVLPGESVRNDSDIARTAKNILEWTTNWPKDSVNVMVENGWVTLSGRLDWEYQKQMAMGAVRHLMGVIGVSNQIVINPKVLKTKVKSEIIAAIKRRANDDANNIQVEVEYGTVTLTGNVKSWSERELAFDSAKHSAGVVNVINLISVAV